MTSAVWRQHDGFLGSSGGCKIPANRCIAAVLLFPDVQEIHSGCCTCGVRGGYCCPRKSSRDKESKDNGVRDVIRARDADLGEDRIGSTVPK